MATPHPTEKATKRLLSTVVLVFLIFLLYRTGDVCFAAVHGLSTTTAFTRLPEVLLWSPDGFPRLGAGAAAHLCASGMGELGACFCCQTQCCVSRSSVTKNSEKHLGSQIAGKKKTLFGRKMLLEREFYTWLMGSTTPEIFLWCIFFKEQCEDFKRTCQCTRSIFVQLPE